MIKGFACFNKNEDVRMRSSSGGIYYVIAEKIISDGGVVYGACYEGTDVQHRRIDTIDGIAPSCGSKYQPSRLGNTFRQVKHDLDEGKKVLFTGTPCQCGGLLSFVGEQENLYCADCICHGIPGRAAWNGYLSSLKKRGLDVVSVNMRDKISGWSGYSWKLLSRDGTIKIQHKDENPFMKGFIADLYLRPSCYECCFKGIDRTTDFTLGDYWGVQRLQPEMFDDKGVSLLLVHSQKGMQLFQQISDLLEYKEAPIDAAVGVNHSLVKSAKLTDGKEKFYSELKKGKDFIEVVERMTRVSLLQKIKRKIGLMIKK